MKRVRRKKKGSDKNGYRMKYLGCFLFLSVPFYSVQM